MIIDGLCEGMAATCTCTCSSHTIADRRDNKILYLTILIEVTSHLNTSDVRFQIVECLW